jgi:hypothetical protein
MRVVLEGNFGKLGYGGGEVFGEIGRGVVHFRGPLCS